MRWMHHQHRACICTQAHHTAARCWSSFPAPPHPASSGSSSSMTPDTRTPHDAQAARHSDLRPHRCNEVMLVHIQSNIPFSESFMGVYSCYHWRTSPEKAGHVSFLGPLDHSQMRAVALQRHSQFSKSERGSQTPERVVARSQTTLTRFSAGPSRSVPGYAFPFTEQTERIQKRARPQPAPGGSRLHANTRLVGVCAFSGFIYTRTESCSRSFVYARPPASNASRWVALGK
jgi:hypothetical protein